MNISHLDVVQSIFDYDKDRYEFSLPDTSKFTQILPKTFKIGLIVGASGSGKSRLLETLEGYSSIDVVWDNNKSVIEQIDENPHSAVEKLLSSGFSSVPQWFLKYSDLSEGQKFRAYVARCSDQSFIKIDEFTSKLDRLTAKNTAYNLYKRINGSNNNISNIIVASPFHDIVNYLNPDWVYNASTLSFSRDLPKRTLHWKLIFITSTDEIKNDFDDGLLYVMKSNSKRWDFYRQYHYLSSSILTNCEYWEVFTISEKTIINIAYIAISPLPLAGIPARREHRLVVIPEVQGMGIGIALSEFMGEHYTGRNYKYYCKTSHPKLGLYRNKHPEKWKATPHNGKKGSGNGILSMFANKKRDKQLNNGESNDIIDKDVSEEKIPKIYYCHQYFIKEMVDAKCNNAVLAESVKDDDDTTLLMEIDPTKEWKPTFLIGVLSIDINRAVVRFKHQKTYFRYNNYSSANLAKNAAIRFLENMNIEHNNPNLYHVKNNNYYICINRQLVIKLDVENFDKIKDKKLCIRNDTAAMKIFYCTCIDGKKSRAYLSDHALFEIPDINIIKNEIDIEIPIVK
jgi:hypothetical protein